MSQRAHRVLDVGKNTFDPRQSALRADSFGRHGETTRCEERGAARGVGMHAAPNVLGGLHVEMRLQLFAEIVVGVRRASAEEARDSRQRSADRSENAHGASCFGARNAAIRSAVWFHSRASRANCLRPAAVSE